MTEEQKKQFNHMHEALRVIAEVYDSSENILEGSQSELIDDPEEALSMAYDNLQATAKNAIRGIQKLS